MARIRPYIKFYGADWRADAGLRLCGFAAKGLWIGMIALMQDAEPFGHLVVNGNACTPKQLAALLGGTETEVKRLLAELERNGVFSRLDEGTIYSRRMIRDREREEMDAVNGGKGGNPKLRGLPNKGPPGLAGGLTPPLKPTTTTTAIPRFPPDGGNSGAPPISDFERFFEAYPKRQGDPEGAAELAWGEAARSPDFPGIEPILGALTRWKAARKLESDPPFAPYAKTWLAEKRWNDWPEPPPPEPHKRDWAEAYPDTWGRLKAATTPNEWAFWLGRCTINGPPHVLYCPDKLVCEKVAQKYGTQIAAMFGDKGVVRLLGEQQGVAA